METRDNVTQAALSLGLSSSGAFSSFETHPLIEPAELTEALGKPKTVAPAYQRPGRLSVRGEPSVWASRRAGWRLEVDLSRRRARASRIAAPTIADLLAADDADDAGRRRRLALLTCMDVRIDVPGALGVPIGSVAVLRNAGARVTQDVLRSLALASHVLGADTVAVMHHTDCRLRGVTDQELQALTGADLAFIPIEDHVGALREDIDVLSSTPYLQPLTLVAGLLYDVGTGEIEELVRWRRPA